MKTHATAVVALWIISSASAAHATQTVFPVRECPNCTETQMRNMAKNGPVGISFVYDLPRHVMHKYETYWDSSCGPQPSGGDSANAIGHGQTKGAQPSCGSFKVAVLEDPVDPDVQATFDALYRVYTYNRPLVTQSKATRVAVLPNDPDTGHPFDPQNIAWEYPQGSYIRFRNVVTGLLGSQSSANAFVPYLGDDIYGWSISGFSVEVTVSAPPGGGITGSLHWDRNSGVLLDLCTPVNLDCVELPISVSVGGTVNIGYSGVIDFNQNLYPSENGQTPGNMTSWHFRNGGADHFADALRHGGVYVPGAGACGYGSSLYLITTRENNRIIFQEWECVPN